MRSQLSPDGPRWRSSRPARTRLPADGTVDVPNSTQHCSVQRRRRQQAKPVLMQAITGERSRHVFSPDGNTLRRRRERRRCLVYAKSAAPGGGAHPSGHFRSAPPAAPNKGIASACSPTPAAGRVRRRDLVVANSNDSISVIDPRGPAKRSAPYCRNNENRSGRPGGTFRSRSHQGQRRPVSPIAIVVVVVDAPRPKRV